MPGSTQNTAVIVHLGTDTKVSKSPKAPSRGCTLVQYFKAIKSSSDAMPFSMENPAIEVLKNLIKKPEILSYVGSAVGASAAESVSQSNKVSKVILDGPDLLGFEVYRMAADSIMATLGQIAGGHTDVVFAAHSRGAVVSFVSAVFIEEVIDFIIANPDIGIDKFYDFLTEPKATDENTVQRIKKILKENLKETNLKTFVEGLKQNIRAAQLSILALDPVPGGFNGFKSGWHTEAPSKVGDLKWLKFMEVIYAEHEASYAFAPQIVHGPQGKVSVITLPGHHGTAQGKYGTQQTGSYLPDLQDGMSAEDFSPLVQEIFLVKLLAFTRESRDHISFDSEKVSDFIPTETGSKWDGKLTRRLKQVVSEFKLENYDSAILALYNRLQGTRSFFTMFRESTYIAMGTLPHVPIQLFFAIKNIFSSEATRLVEASDRLVIRHASDKDGYRYDSFQRLLQVNPMYINIEHYRLKYAAYDKKIRDKSDELIGLEEYSSLITIDEIARMIGGLKITEQTLAHASELLEDALV